MLSCLSRACTRVKRWFVPPKRCNILLLGLDNAGKTSLLAQLQKQSPYTVHEPTQKPQNAVVEWNQGATLLNVFDMGGHAAARRIWTQYIRCDIHGIVFVVDAADEARMAEARDELNNLMTDKRLKDATFLILGNKCDLLEAVDEATLRDSLGVPQFDGEGTNCKVVLTSIQHGTVVGAIDWLVARM